MQRTEMGHPIIDNPGVVETGHNQAVYGERTTQNEESMYDMYFNTGGDIQV